MIEDANISDNNSTSDVSGAVTRRRPGRPRGLPKPEGSGRQPGTPNRVGKEARDLAGKYTTKAFKRLAEMLDSKDDKAAAIACREILDRAYGRPISPTELTGKDGAPLVPVSEMSNTELASRIAFVLALGAKDVGATMPHARKPTVIEQTPDPFAAQRAEQAREIAAPTAQPEGDTRPELTDYQRAVAAQKAEDAAARAEGRMPRPAPVWVDENRRPRAGEDFSPTTATVTRIRPRQR